MVLGQIRTIDENGSHRQVSCSVEPSIQIILAFSQDIAYNVIHQNTLEVTYEHTTLRENSR